MIPAGWVRLWGIAVVAHIVGNARWGQLVPDPTTLGVSTFALLVLAVVLVLAPGERPVLVAVSIGVIVVAWLEAPYLGNHWQLAALVSIAVLVALTRPDQWGWFAPVGRWMLLGFYVWAAFAKLNSAFLDPAVSCGLEYANRSLASWGLPTIASTSVVAWLPVLGAVGIEMAVPLLLILRRTRTFGVILAVGFHGLVSLDLDQHFYDFTSVLFALFVLFLSDDVRQRLTDRLVLRRVGPFVLVAGLVGLVGLMPLGPTSFYLVRIGAFVVWIPYLAWMVVGVIRARGGGVQEGQLRVRSVAGVGLVAVVVGIGLLPYLEVRTATSWNMYSNLRTVDGESNHVLVRSTFPLTDHQSRIVTLLETEDEGLAVYVDSGYGLTERRFLHYLSEHPDVEVRYEVGGAERTARGADVGVRLGVVSEKLQLFRAIDLTTPTRCQTTWMPAR